jgi:signal transduction histidine kinase
MLITILPALILAWIWKGHLDGTELPPVAVWSAAGVVLLVIVLGYALLLKYPVSIVRLRRYLSTLADGGIPDKVNLPEDEDDLAAVQRHMERIVKLAEDRIHMMERRHAVALEAERQRVMVESMGAMCHHLGQPATVLGMCLFRLKNNPTPQETLEILKDTEEAFETITRLLEEFRTLARYASEPYLSSSPTPQGNPESRIIKV